MYCLNLCKFKILMNMDPKDIYIYKINEVIKMCKYYIKCKK